MEWLHRLRARYEDRVCSAALEERFSGVAAWRREFVALAHALVGAPGWVVLSYARGERRLYNQIRVRSPAVIDAAPLLALDMYEHAYHLDFGANASAYIDAFMRNVDWSVVSDRLMAARGNGTPTRASQGRDDLVPSVSVEELAAGRARGERIQVLDARPKHYFSRSGDMMEGATWRDPIASTSGPESSRTRPSWCTAHTDTRSAAT